MRTVRRILPLFAVLALASGQQRVVESVVPALAYGARCSSTVELQNLSDRPVVVDGTVGNLKLDLQLHNTFIVPLKIRM